MTRSLRPGKVFVDWSQNAARKTTATPYAVRSRDVPAVSTPVTWEEVAGCGRAEQLVFLAGDVGPGCGTTATYWGRVDRR
ncbi:ATP-dependent DNA ligase OS=Streptomyces tendae OX=1932 GN=GUR47_14335 PE=4 SV=1 [Streptomyces tendae]